LFKYDVGTELFGLSDNNIKKSVKLMEQTRRAKNFKEIKQNFIHFRQHNK
jgi:hypothetical protein